MNRFVILASLVMAALPLQAQTVMKPGGWAFESSTLTETPTGESKKGPEAKVEMCLSTEFLAREPYLSPKLDESKMAARNAKCQTENYQRKGNQASWLMRCEMADGSRLEANFDNRASADTLNMRMVSNVQRGDNRARVTLNAQARHIGACTPDMTRP